MVMQQQEYLRFCQYPIPDITKGYCSIRWFTDSALKNNVDNLINLRKQAPKLVPASLARCLFQDLKASQRHLEPIKKKLLSQNPCLTQDELERRGWRILRQREISHRHLTAWLSRTSFQVFKKIRFELYKSPNSPVDLTNFSQDLLQIALEPTLDSYQFFKNFKSNEKIQDEEWYTNLQQYSYKKVYGFTVDRLRERDGMTTFKRSSLWLVATASKTRVKKALRYYGKTDTLTQYLTLWQVLKEVYQAKQIHIQYPSPEEFQSIADRYNDRVKPQIPIQAEEIKPVLEEIGKVIRKYIEYSLDSYDRPARDDSDSTILDMIKDDALPPEEVIELQGKKQEVLEVFAQFFATCSIKEKKFSLFVFGLKGYIIQQHIRSELNFTNQPAVSRAKGRLVSQAVETLEKKGFKLGNPEDIQGLEIAKKEVESYFQEFYRTLLSNTLLTILQSLSPLQQEICVRYRIYEQDLNKVAETVEISPQETEEKLEESKRLLYQQLIKSLHENLGITLKAEEPAFGRQALQAYLNYWLITETHFGE